MLKALNVLENVSALDVKITYKDKSKTRKNTKKNILKNSRIFKINHKWLMNYSFRR